MNKQLSSEKPNMFHPVKNNSSEAWFPSNDAGQILTIISRCWEDILILFEIRKRESVKYNQKLIFKYILIELRSMIDLFKKLQSIIFNKIAKQKNIKIISGQISEKEINDLKIRFKAYNKARDKVENSLNSVRNKYSAHREVNELWHTVDYLEKLIPDDFSQLFTEIPKLFETIRQLDIFDWIRSGENGTIEICCSGLDNDLSAF